MKGAQLDTMLLWILVVLVGFETYIAYCMWKKAG